MKLNLGIRRRLAPLLDNGRDEIELMHAILFSLPGAPVLYYGDEIGMGDNVYLGDRDGVRTPMQWTGDRNGGFSRADFAQLYLPPLMDPVYGFQAVNVEAQLRTPTSLLRWVHRFIALRKEHPVFGLGTYEPLRPENTRIFAHVRRFADDTPLRAQPRPLGAGGRARPRGVRGPGARGDAREDDVSSHRIPAISPDTRPRGWFWFRLEEEEGVTSLRSREQELSSTSRRSAGTARRPGGVERVGGRLRRAARLPDRPRRGAFPRGDARDLPARRRRTSSTASPRRRSRASCPPAPRRQARPSTRRGDARVRDRRGLGRARHGADHRG